MDRTYCSWFAGVLDLALSGRMLFHLLYESPAV